MIDLSVAAARKLGADLRPVSLAELHGAYLKLNPGISKGKTLDSFGATINFHTINMPSRFPEPSNPYKKAPWFSKPRFKRIEYGKYMLLSPYEIQVFEQLAQEMDPRIFRKNYDDLDDLFGTATRG